VDLAADTQALDEPTDNLDLLSAEALEAALARFEGTTMCMTHDRWFLRQFDRFIVFDHDCSVKEALDVDTALYLVTGDPSFPFRASAVKDLSTTPTRTAPCPQPQEVDR
jgi:hypothetical protein